MDSMANSNSTPQQIAEIETLLKGFESNDFKNRLTQRLSPAFNLSIKALRMKNHLDYVFKGDVDSELKINAVVPVFIDALSDFKLLFDGSQVIGTTIWKEFLFNSQAILLATDSAEEVISPDLQELYRTKKEASTYAFNVNVSDFIFSIEDKLRGRLYGLKKDVNLNVK